MFPRYPYIDLSDRNLDFLSKTVRELENEIKNFVSINALKYANPIQWNITKSYEKNTIVITPDSGVAYISVAAVPSGVNITRREYWTKVFDLSYFLVGGNANFAINFERDYTLQATMATNAGSWVVWNSILYRAIDDISVGDLYKTGVNIERLRVEEAINELVVKIDNEIANRISADSALGGRIDDEITARTNADTALGGRIDDEITARTNADTALDGRINNEMLARQSLETTLVTAISTNNEGENVNFSANYIQGTIIWWHGALYKVNGNVSAGAPISSNVTATSIGYELTNSYGVLEYFRDKKVIVAGDSLSNETVNPPNWVVSFRNELAKVNATVTNISFGGSSWSDGNNPNTGMAKLITQTNLSSYDILIIENGTNDCTGQIAIGSWSTTSGFNTFIGAMWEVFNYISTNNPDLKVYWVIPPKRDLSNAQYPTPVPLNVYRAAIRSMCNYFNWGMIDWNCALPNLNPTNVNIKNSFMPDALHISSAYAPIVADYTINRIAVGGDTEIGCVLSQCEYTSFGSGVTGVLRFNYDTSGHVHVEFQLTLIGVNNPVKLFTISNDVAPLFPLPMLYTQGGLPCTFEYITDGFYIVPKTNINGDYLICQADFTLDKLNARGVWSF